MPPTQLCWIYITMGTTDLQQNMEDEDWDPRELFVTIGMLIVEARLPELSAKGRTEGPHCPQFPKVNKHVCDYQDIRCCEAKKFKMYMETLWKNSIPMCIELLLFPKCRHNQQQTDIMFVDSNAEHGGEQFLLERWDVNMTPKRWTDKSEKFVTGMFLVQAMRSYLFFSQLSSWLNSTGGLLPLTIAYRLYAPGESRPYLFEGDSTVHHFPVANLSHSTVRVSVTASQRMKNIPILLCQNPMSSVLTSSTIITDQLHKSKPSKFPPDNSEPSRRKKTLTTAAICDNSNNSDVKKFNPKKISSTTTTISNRLNNLTQSKSKTSSINKKEQPQTISAPSSSVSPAVSYSKIPSQQKNLSFSSTRSVMSVEEDSLKLASKFAKLEVKSSNNCTFSTASRNMFSEKPLVFHTKDDLDNDQSENKTPVLHSPKVLLTNCKSGEQSYYSKQKRNNSGSDVKWNTKTKWYPELLCQPGMQELTKPLTSDQIEAYLASLPTWGTSLPKVRRTCLENIPVTKCKFQIGDELFDKDTEKSISSTVNPLSKTALSSYVGFSSENKSEITSSVTSAKKRGLATKDKYDTNNISRNLHEDFNHNKTGMKRSAAVWMDLSQDINENRTEATYSANNNSLKDSTSSVVDETRSQDISDRSNRVDCCETAIKKDDATKTAEEKSDVFLEADNCSIVNGSKDYDNSKENESKEHFNDITKDPVSPNQGKRSLYATILRKDFNSEFEKKCIKKNVPSIEDITNFHKNLNKSTSMVFNASTGLPTQSSPAPVKKKSGRFDYDSSLTSTKAIKNALSCSKLVVKSSSCDEIDNKENNQKTFSTSAPASTNCLLGNFEESILNGRIEPSGVVEGFVAEIGASGTFCPKHICLPVTSYFFSLSDDNAPSPYLGHINLESYSKKGYHVPKVGTVQVTLFNPNKTVVKMFVVMYDLQDMPSNSQTFMRQRTMYMPADPTSDEHSYLRYLIHLRISSSKSGKLYLHTDVRLIFARDRFEYDARVANYELRSFTEGPRNPKFSSKR
ncbi:protein FAM214A isoform X1 [Octopus sinensis]|uniref:Protein FAM214A isoform X1 n=1 Tax=Octopus sinensis TaxID=2607531 RepID=A0A6P7STT5_9MOLL|nr:protein FAM214A isoform X1 [Octopus sinensis]XP_036362523.1 protein FAM214A isoform X1 [Octopus sinensis]